MRFRHYYSEYQGRLSERKTRLFMIACCRLLDSNYFDPELDHFLEMAHRCADDGEYSKAADRYSQEITPGISHDEDLNYLPEDLKSVLHRIEARTLEIPEESRYERYRKPQNAILHAITMCFVHQPAVIRCGAEGDSAVTCAEIVEMALHMCRAKDEHRRPEDLISEFIPVPLKSDSIVGDNAIRLIAQEMYDRGVFSEMPILADALEEAGCDDEHILAHCRDSHVVHVRGCWVVDLVLGKS